MFKFMGDFSEVSKLKEALSGAEKAGKVKLPSGVKNALDDMIAFEVSQDSGRYSKLPKPAQIVWAKNFTLSLCVVVHWLHANTEELIEMEKEPNKNGA
jgi:hypothetical protein